MPIPVTCPGCSASFNVKDEFAGKRGRCPKCDEPFTLPKLAMPAMVMAIPKASAKPIAASRTEPEVDEEEARPKSKKGRKDDDDDDDRPRKRGKKQKPKSNLLLLLGIGGAALMFLIVAGIVAAVVLSGSTETAKSTGNSQPPPVQPGGNPNLGMRPNPNPGVGNPVATEVSADTVVREQEIDFLATEARYKNSTIVTEGTVHKVFRRTDRGESGAEVAVRLSAKTKGEPDGVLAYCVCRPEDDTKGAELTIGQTIKMRGKSGVNTLNVDGCEILSVGPDPAIKMKLADLVAEFSKGDAAAMKKYKGKWFTLTDAVIESKDEKANTFKLVNAVKGTGRLEARRPSNEQVDQKLFSAAKVGDRIIIKCTVSYGFPFMYFYECRLVNDDGGTGRK